MRPVTVVVGPLTAASANNIALSQTPGAAGALTLNGSTVVNGVAVLDHARRVLITTTDTTHTFTITGTSPTGTLVSEVVQNAGTSVQSQLDYLTVTSIVINGAASAAVTAGTSGVASTPWVRLDEWARPEVAIQCNISGTVNYTVQGTLDDPNSPTNPVIPSAVTWINSPDTNAVAAAAAIQTSYGGYASAPALTPTFVRITLNSGTGTVTATVTQLGAVPY
jgi:hypothetical protein